MLSHTHMLVELLINGLLVLCALFLLGVNLLPDGVRMNLLQWIGSNMAVLDKSLLALVPLEIALAYAVGILSEIGTRIISDKLLARTRLQHLVNFVRENKKLLAADSLFARHIDSTSGNLNVRESFLIGEMRFVVMMNSDRLYREIESQINQLRVLRVLFVFLVLLGLWLVVILVRQLAGELTLFSAGGLVLIIMLLGLDIVAIRNRYQRYCRAVEYSYKALLLGQNWQKS